MGRRGRGREWEGVTDLAVNPGKNVEGLKKGNGCQVVNL